VEWEPDQIRWYVDDQLFSEIHRRDLSPFHWPYDKDYYIILNVAVGGLWPGMPNTSTQLPQEMRVDYVRVYNKTGEVVARQHSSSAQQPSLQVYPNPAHTQLNIAPPADLNVADLQLMDVQGRTVVQTTWRPGQVLQVETLPAGIYMLRMQAEGRTWQQKVQILH
jgi:beta-glucanase (GH16 family)